MIAAKTNMVKKAEPEQTASTTLDGLLDRRVMLEQPVEGYRVAVDTVLLAAAVVAHAGEKILDLGCGAGGAMLCLACRVRGIAVTGIDIQNEFVLLCRDNIVRNKSPADLSVQYADATKLPPALMGLFNHAMMNPPYHDESRHDVSALAQKRAANAEKTGDLALWIAGAARALKSSGALTLIHRADRREEILILLKNDFGAIEILPVLPKEGAPPKRIIVRARKGTAYTLTQRQNFVLHQEDGPYTNEAETILRHMKALESLKQK